MRETETRHRAKETQKEGNVEEVEVKEMQGWEQKTLEVSFRGITQ